MWGTHRKGLLKTSFEIHGEHLVRYSCFDSGIDWSTIDYVQSNVRAPLRPLQYPVCNTFSTRHQVDRSGTTQPWVPLSAFWVFCNLLIFTQIRICGVQSSKIIECRRQFWCNFDFCCQHVFGPMKTNVKFAKKVFDRNLY